MPAPAHQGQDLLYGVPGVDADIEQVLPDPEQAELPAQVRAAPHQVYKADGRDQQLEDGAAQGSDEVPEKAQENMAGFMERQVDEIEERKIILVFQPLDIKNKKAGRNDSPGLLVSIF